MIRFFNEFGKRIELGAKDKAYLDDLLYNYSDLCIFELCMRYYHYSWRGRYRKYHAELERFRKLLVRKKNRNEELPAFDEEAFKKEYEYNHSVARHARFIKSMTISCNKRATTYKEYGDMKCSILVCAYNIKRDRVEGSGSTLKQLFGEKGLDQEIIDNQAENHPLYESEKGEYKIDEEGLKIFGEAMEKNIANKIKQIKRIYLK